MNSVLEKKKLNSWYFNVQHRFVTQTALFVFSAQIEQIKLIIRPCEVNFQISQTEKKKANARVHTQTHAEICSWWFYQTESKSKSSTLGQLTNQFCPGVCMWVLCERASARPRTFDWRHATAGSNYKDMRQRVEDCCFMQQQNTHLSIKTKPYSFPQLL